jgi:hypothetical protein
VQSINLLLASFLGRILRLEYYLLRFVGEIAVHTIYFYQKLEE